MKLDIVNGQNEKVGALELNEDVFGGRVKTDLIWESVVQENAAMRRGTKAQKTRAEVSGSGKKPWKQKGTGRARVGSIRSPIWVGGGRAFAAKPRSFVQKVNRKMYRGAIRSMLSELARQERLVVTDALELEAPKTKMLVGKLAEFGL